jgi:hypothetical protein
MFLIYFQIVNPLIALVFNVLIQIISVRYIKISLLKSLIFGFIIGFLFLLGTYLYGYYAAEQLAVEFWSLSIVNFLTYSALGYCYAHFINLGEGARRIRIVKELYKSEAGLTLDELLKIYDSRQMIENRIDRLVSGGQIILRNNRYFIGKPIMLYIARIIVLMKLIVMGKKSEFE